MAVQLSLCCAGSPDNDFVGLLDLVPWQLWRLWWRVWQLYSMAPSDWRRSTLTSRLLVSAPTHGQR